ncbi:hypothetical protein ACJMK2_012627 [Sinanodonta woodiana]|uniref:Integrator complex subunit 2 n=1 Tax=Sinanodonta woodiana TaxID=1069815 RepID=A0ABD3VA08_SINWO
MRTNLPHVKSEIFQAMQNVDVQKLGQFTEHDLRPVLPCLVRMALCAPVDTGERWTKARKIVLKILSGIEVVNSIVALLSIDFHALEQDVRKEQQLRSKIGGNQTESVLVSQLQTGLALEFEHSDPARRIRLLLSELLFILSQVKESKHEFYQKQSELFESEVYLEEVSDVLCIAQAELPTLLPIKDVAEALLHVQNGAWLLCQLIANSPDCFKEVCCSLVANGERQDEEGVGGRKRMELLQTLCAMNPSESLNIRSLCVKYCTMPGLTISLSLEMVQLSLSKDTSIQPAENDLVSFVSGLLLGNNADVRTWFSQFIKVSQKRKRDPGTSMLYAMRLELLEQLIAILPEGDQCISPSHVVKACSFIRLYCALKGMATLRFTDEEMKLLLRLVTSKPPPTQSGARFVSLGLCMLIACPYLLGNQEQERLVVDWIKWLMAEESSFERETDKSSSFGEMLFLIAIHFHGNHMHNIAELVCSTLGMKSAVKANSLARIRQIFTQEIFTEQVITSHAVTVPVTVGLNSNINGYLPIHCIYQLLKSRAFSKYKVPIKDWIYKQICCSSYPLHPLLLSLIEAYVNTIIIKSAKTDHTNDPITDQEILAVYRDSVFTGSSQMGEKKKKPAARKNLMPQLLILYYVLLYEDTLSKQLKNIALSNRAVQSYPQSLMAQVPINYLMQEAQRYQDLYGGLFSSLLRLLVTQYPHLCIVEDWLEVSMQSSATCLNPDISLASKCVCTPQAYNEALTNLKSSPTPMLQILNKLLHLPVEEVLQFSDCIVSSLPAMLDPDIPRKVVDLVKRAWFRVHTLTPRSLRLATVNALRPQESGKFKYTSFTELDITIDPLIVLRCDDRIFRCPPVLEILLRVLVSYSQACRVYMENHIQSNPVMDNNNQIELERQELKNALLAAQDSAIIQILLECCLPKPGEESYPEEDSLSNGELRPTMGNGTLTKDVTLHQKVRGNFSANDESKQKKSTTGLLSNLREVQCLICSYIHQSFISDPNLAKLVHFQKFAIKLMSYLGCQYALPKSLSIAKLCLSVMITMAGVCDNEERVNYFLETIPYLTKVCQAFPPLCEDVTSLLTQVGRICYSHLSFANNTPESEFSLENGDSEKLEPAKKFKRGGQIKLSQTIRYHHLYKVVQQTFSEIATKTVVTRDLY